MIVPGIIALAVYLFTRLKRDVGNLSTRIVSIKPDGISLTGIRLKVIMEVLNTRNQSLSADKIIAKVMLNGSQIGDLETNKPIVVAAANRATIEIPFQVYPLKLMAFINAFKAVKKGGTVLIEFDGYTHLGGSQVPYKDSFKLSRDMLPF